MQLRHRAGGSGEWSVADSATVSTCDAANAAAHDAGRAFEVAPSGEVVWSYVNGWDDKNVGWVLDIGRYPAEFGDFAGKSCN